MKLCSSFRNSIMCAALMCASNARWFRNTSIIWK
jgi:hypothetical protein